jgi:hypothetical protein
VTDGVADFKISNAMQIRSATNRRCDRDHILEMGSASGCSTTAAIPTSYLRNLGVSVTLTRWIRTVSEYVTLGLLIARPTPAAAESGTVCTDPANAQENADFIRAGAARIETSHYQTGSAYLAFASRHYALPADPMRNLERPVIDLSGIISNGPRQSE